MLKSLVAGAGLVMCLAACATAPKTTADASRPPAGCVAQTGTMIKVPPNACTGPGNVYTREDLDRTGSTDVGSALRMLDPAISGH